MANKKISELSTRTPSLSDLLLVGDPSSGYSYKCTVTALATIIETDIADGYVTIGTTQTISGAKTFSNNLTLTSVANANTDTDKFLVLNGSNVVNFRTGSEVLSDIGGQGALTLTTTGSSGASTLVGNTLNIPTYTLSGLGGISGSGSTGYLPKFTGTTSIGNSIVQDNGSTLNIAGGIICNAISASSLTSDQYIAFQNINTSYSLSGYTLLYATLTNPGFIFNFGDGTRIAIFRYASGSYTYTLPSATGTLALTSDITSSISGTANYIPKFTGSSSIGNSVIYESSSNIGIGTISPSQKLEVSGTLRVRSATEILDISAPVGKIDFDNVSGDPLGFSIGGSEKMRLDASGNLGLGVTPSAWGSTGNTKAFQLGTISSLYEAFTGTAVGNNTFYNGTNDKYLTTAPATVYLQLSGQHIWYNAPSGTAGNTISFSQIMTLTASGNLGIGTTSPGAKLDVKGGNGNQLFLDNTGQQFTQLTFLNNGVSKSALWVDNTNSLFEHYVVGGIGQTFYGGGSERMRITSGGNVGIGTTSPTFGYGTGLQITSTLAGNLRVNTAGYTGLDIIGGANGDGYVYLRDNNPLIFGTNNTERMRITSGGDVGIGTTAPATKLEVAGSVRAYVNSATATELFAENNTVKVRLIAGTSSSFLSTTTNHPLIFETNNAERMRITSAGNVGIGTTTPGSKLSVVGLPTSSTGLSAGDIWNDSGTLKIV